MTVWARVLGTTGVLGAILGAIVDLPFLALATDSGDHLGVLETLLALAAIGTPIVVVVAIVATVKTGKSPRTAQRLFLVAAGGAVICLTAFAILSAPFFVAAALNLRRHRHSTSSATTGVDEPR